MGLSEQDENSRDPQDVLARAIEAHGAPKELLSDYSKAFKQLRQGSTDAVENFLASKRAMPIRGLSGKPTIQGKVNFHIRCRSIF